MAARELAAPLAFWPSIASRLRPLATALTRSRPSVAALIVATGGVVAVGIGSQAFVISAPVVLDSDAIALDRGFAYTAEIAPPNGLLRFAASGGYTGSHSTAPSLLENGTRVVRAGALHQDIRDQGMGRYALRGAYLYFSASDNTDPRSNGRRYAAVVPMALSQGAACAVGLLSTAILLVSCGLLRGRRRAKRGR